jgi:hypothetical protein
MQKLRDFSGILILSVSKGRAHFSDDFWWLYVYEALIYFHTGGREQVIQFSAAALHESNLTSHYFLFDCACKKI